MLEKLHKMDESKRARLINAVIDEFSKYPIEKASTNSIVKKAGISKGLLFHYFDDKKDLFDSASEYVLNLTLREVSENVKWDTTDIFERIKELVLAKVEIARRHPGLSAFVVNLLKENDNTIDSNNVKERYKKSGLNIDAFMARVYTENIDFSKFKDQKKIHEYIEIINWTLEGWGKKLAENGFWQNEKEFMARIPGEFDKYITVLKEAFYSQDAEE